MTGRELWQAVTDLGDAGLLLPLSGVAAVILWRLESARCAASFAAGLGACIVGIAVLKVLFASCANQWQVAIHSPSGHVGLSTVVYGSLALVAGGTVSRRRMAAAAAVAAALVAAIGVSRIQLGAHNWPEVILGLLVGGAVLTGAWAGYRRLRRAGPPLATLSAALLLTAMAAYGLHLRAEPSLQGFASRFAVSTWACGRVGDDSSTGVSGRVRP